MYVCIVMTFRSMDQICKAANPSSRGRLKRRIFPVPVSACKFRLCRQVRPSGPALACSFSTLRLKLVLTRGIPALRDGVYFFIPSTAIGSRKHTSGVHCQETTGVRPAVLRVLDEMGST